MGKKEIKCGICGKTIQSNYLIISKGFVSGYLIIDMVDMLDVCKECFESFPDVVKEKFKEHISQ